MALVTVSSSLGGTSIPFAALPAVTRAPGATSTTATFNVTGSSATITLFGAGFTFDGQPLPATGTIAVVEYRLNGVALSWTATGLSADAAAFRLNAADLATFLFGGADVMVGASGADRLRGYGGNDSLSGGDGNDTLYGGEGNDTLVSGNGQDRLLGEAGDDLIEVRGDSETFPKYIDGGTGTDALKVRAGNLSLSTILGVEILAIEAGSAVTLTAAQFAAFDTLSIAVPASTSASIDIVGGGTIDLGAIAFEMAANQGVDLYAIGTPGVTLLGRDVADGLPDDEVFVSGGGATIATYGGNDRVTAASGGNTVDLGAGDDKLWFGEQGLHLLLLGDGNDTVNAFSDGATADGRNTIDGGAGNDRIVSLSAADSLIGGSGNDTIDGAGGADTMLGGSGTDSMLGGAGNDRLVGGGGGDTLSGGTGADRFVYDDGDSGVVRNGQLVEFDRILDFNRTQGDRIDLAAVDANTALFGDQAFSAPLASSSSTPIGAGSLRYTVTATETIIEGSTDADAQMEFRIVVAVPGYAPVAADFIL